MNSAEQIVTSSIQICELAERLPPELIRWKPAEDVWSILEILGHVEEIIPYWTAQTMQMIRKPSELWGRDHTNLERKAAVENVAKRDLASVTAGIRAAARDSGKTLGALSDADLAVEATSKNPRWGLKPASFVVEHLLVEHLGKHLGQMQRNISQYEQKGQG